MPLKSTSPLPNLARPYTAPDSPSTIPAWAGVSLCLLLAAAQVALGGYQLGVGNQSIQIAFLKHAINPALFTTDPMVTQTMPMYPSYFFRLLAPLLHLASLENLYLILHIVTSFATLATVYLLARNIFRSHASALASAGLLVAGHLNALAGDGLYSPGFTHTYAALPMAIGALALAYRGRWIWACILAGLLFNFHALTAAYTLLMLAAAMFADMRQIRFAEWATRAFLCGSIVVATAAPTLALMTASHQTFSAEWINLTRIRSADHSFPSTWWAASDADIPRYLLFFALFVLSWSFSPLRREEELGGAKQGSRITVLMTSAVLALFAVGYVFTELVPLPLVIRLQPFRASRLLLILMLVHMAHAAIAAIRIGYTGAAPDDEENPSAPPPSTLARTAELSTGILILATIAVPTLLPLLPVTVILALATALIAGHLSWRQAIVTVATLLIAFLAVIQIQFPAPLFSPDLNYLPETNVPPAVAGIRALAALILLLAGVFAIMAATIQAVSQRALVAGGALLAGIIFSGLLFIRESSEDLSPETAALAPVSAWARNKTPTNALFLTPTNMSMSNFRISAERSLVASWRDGTQLYFSADFGPLWLDRMTKLESGFALTVDGTRMASRGDDSLESLDDKMLLELASQYKANYILLRTPSSAAVSRPRSLAVAYSDEHFTAYEPRVAPPVIALAPPRAPTAATPRTPATPSTPAGPPQLPTYQGTLPPGVTDRVAWADAERFMRTTVADNIERYRKADVTFQILDASGRPIQNAAIRADQTKLAFTIGISLGFFEPNNISPNGDMKPVPVRPIELEKAPEVFNGSMIPFSAKWQYIEPQKGQYHWSDLDKYVDYCAAHDWTVEFHHLSGILPGWVEAMGGVDAQRGLSFSHPIPAMQTEFDRHCLVTVTRYADRVKYWQVVNEKYMMQYTPPVFKMLRQKFPNNQFGLSDCVRFWDGSSGAGATPRGTRVNDNQYKGADAVDWLISQGVHPDFFSIHGHWPLGLWADPREIYNVIAYFQQRKVKVHISEEFLQLNSPIYGPLRSGTWTPELQGEYMVRLLTVAFSNPNVDLVNYWGMAPDGWGAVNSGFIDASGRSRASFDILKKLTTETWRSHASGQTTAEGLYLARVFHGRYQVSVTLPGGQTTTATVLVPEQPTATVRLQLTPQNILKAL